jgi:hypothetical protein
MAWYFDELDDKLKAIANELPRIFDKMEAAALQEVKVLHRKGIDNGKVKKPYKSNAYKKMRLDKYGQNTSYINMQLSRDLTFVTSMTIGLDSENNKAYGIVNNPDGETDTSTIFKGQVERNKHGDILKVKKEQINASTQVARKVFEDEIKKLFAQFK